MFLLMTATNALPLSWNDGDEDNSRHDDADREKTTINRTWKTEQNGSRLMLLTDVDHRLVENWIK